MKRILLEITIFSIIPLLQMVFQDLGAALSAMADQGIQMIYDTTHLVLSVHGGKQ